jgi:anti-sigma factor RsiW
MKKFWKKKNRAVRPDSPDDGELLAYLDGELEPERQTEIRRLLEGDWKLRVRLAELERDIEVYVKATDPHRQSEMPPFEEVWRGVMSRLTEPLEPAPAETELRLREQNRISLSSRLGRLSEALLLRPVMLRWSVAVTMVVIVTTGIVFWLLTSEYLRAVSAEELLQRAMRSEAAQIKQVAEPVVYRRIQVKRTGANEAVTWESWREAGKNQFRQRVADGQGWRFLRTNKQAAPALIAEIEAVFQANHLDLQRPLSAAAFAEWRKTVRPKSETVKELALPGSSANHGLKLTTIVSEPYAVNAIIEATLAVRKSDWHTVAQRLKVQGETEVREYELSETAYEVLPLHALTVFADLVPTPSPAPAIIAAASPAASPSIIATASPAPAPPPSEAEVKEAEVAAMYALHQARADLGEQIEVVREAGQGVIVRGLVETPERKQQLTEALRDLPLVAAQVQTIEEATRQAAASQPARAAEAVTPNEPMISTTSGASGAQAGNAFEQRLARYFAEREPAGSDRGNIDLKIAQLFNEVVTESSAAMSEAWALRRLLERFAAEKENDISPAARQRIEEMTANHIARLKTQNHKLRARLEPVLLSIAGGKTPAAPAPVESTRQAHALRVFRAVEQAQRMIQRLVTGAASAATPEEAARQLLVALARLDHELLSFEQAITR